MTKARFGLLSSAAQIAVLQGGFARLDINESDMEKKGGAETTTEKEMLGQMLTAMGDMAKRMDAIEARRDRRPDSSEEGDEEGMEDEEEEDCEDSKKDESEEEEEEGKPARLKNMKKDSRRKDESEEEEEREDADMRMDRRRDSRRKDESEEEEEREDSARHDSVTLSRDDWARIQYRVNDLERTSPVALTDAQMDEMTDIQSRADSVFQAHGKHAPRFVAGESPLGYRRRLARELQPHSKQFAKVNLVAVQDAEAFKHFEDGIYHDAAAAAHDPSLVEAGTLRAIRTTDPAGRTITSFVGDAKTGWLDDFTLPVRKMKSISNTSVR